MAKPLMCPPELLERDLTGRRIIVTGANSGIGFITAKQLAKQGASVTLACRNEAEGEARATEILSEFPAADIEVRKLDSQSPEPRTGNATPLLLPGQCQGRLLSEQPDALQSSAEKAWFSLGEGKLELKGFSPGSESVEFPGDGDGASGGDPI